MGRPATRGDLRRQIEEPDWLKFRPDHVQAAVRRLLRDSRTSKMLSTLLASDCLYTLAGEFEVASYNHPWDKKTQRERDEWRANFESTLHKLKGLMDDGPNTPAEWGFPVRGHVLMALANKLGLDLPPGTDVDRFFRMMGRFEAAADDLEWTISDALDSFAHQALFDAQIEQILKKPGDKKASRAKFIIWLCRRTSLSAQEVATVATVMFDESDIDGRVVRRLKAGRTDSSES